MFDVMMRTQHTARRAGGRAHNGADCIAVCASSAFGRRWLMHSLHAQQVLMGASLLVRSVMWCACTICESNVSLYFSGQHARNNGATVAAGKKSTYLKKKLVSRAETSARHGTQITPRSCLHCTFNMMMIPVVWNNHSLQLCVFLCVCVSISTVSKRERERIVRYNM